MMEMLQNLWRILCTEDEMLTKYVCLSLTFIEIYVTMKLFTTILHIEYNKKQRNWYIGIMSILTIISTLFIPKEYSIFVHLIITPIVIKVIFKATILKSIFAEIFPMIISALLETIYLKLCYLFFNIRFYDCINIIIYRLPYMLFLYFTIYMISISVNFLKLNIYALEYLNRTQKKLLIINLCSIVVCIGLQFYITLFYNSTQPLVITFISFIFLIIYFIISIYSIIKSANLEIAKRDLEQSQLYNKSLELLYENIRAFKHDFSNIVTALGGYIYANDMSGLSNYYDKLMDECHINNNLCTLNPQVINNAAIYNILATKYYKADELGISIDLTVFINLNDLKVDIYDFTRILGILLDNSIEAASKCTEKIIKIDIRDIKIRHCQSLTIENTYLDKNIDLSKLSEKGYTSKKDDSQNHGIGLWKVSKILKKHNNLLLDTSKDDNFFKQELIIYY